jgi:CheY-like chemotaxis protein
VTEKSSIKVLVVDDTDHVRDMLSDMLELDGFQVVAQADSGKDAVASAKEKQPDVIVMDFKMPGIDGVDASKMIRAIMPELPIILYTAYLDPKLEARAKKAGVAMCVAKTEGLNQLERHISEICRDLL